MPWFVVDDSAHSHPKIVKAGNAAVGLWMRCGSYAAQHLTDGIVPGDIARMYGTPPQINKLVRLRLWHPTDHTCEGCQQPSAGDYIMHDYLAYNPTRKNVLDRRARAAEKKRRQRDGGGLQKRPPQRNAEVFEDESDPNRMRIEDESDPIHRPLFDEYAGQEAVSLGDSLGTRARAFPSPPLLEEDVADVEGSSTGSGGLAISRPDGLAPIDASGFSLTDAMRRWARRDGYADLVDIDHATAQFVSHYRSTGARRNSWPDAWQKWIRDDAKKAADRRAVAGNVLPLSGRPSTADQRVATGQALAAKFREEEQRALEAGPATNQEPA